MKIKLEKTPIILPFLVSLYAILSLLAWNISEVLMRDALRPLLISIAATLLIFWIAYLFTKDIHGASVITSIILLLFFSYGHVYSLIKSVPGIGVLLGRHRYLMTTWVIISLVLIYLFIRKPSLAAPTGKYLILVFSLLLAFSLTQIGYFFIRKVYYESTYKPSAQAEISFSPGQEAPDIYYIILDAYGRSDVLRSVYGVDNSDFLAKLKESDFFVATCSQSNYMRTILSLTSTFNMEYLDTLNPDITQAADTSWMFPYLKHSRVREMLSALGYKTIVFQTSHEEFTWDNADILYQPDNFSNLISPFEGLLLRTTPIRAWIDVHLKEMNLSENELDRNRILYTLEKLPEIPSITGPKLVFVHLVIPHPPFVFGPNGEWIDIPYELVKGNFYTDENYKRGYSAAVLYIDKRIREIVPQLIEKSKVPPIIVIAGDHGPAPIGGEQNSMRNINALYLPGGSKLLYDHITPVNTFRVIFNIYFNGTYELLPDKSYYSANGSFFDLVEIQNDCR